MDKPLDLLDFINLNKESDYSSKELKNFIMIHGSLEYNIKKHIRLLNKIPEINESRKNTKWHKSRSFHLLMQKIQEIQANGKTKQFDQNTLPQPKKPEGFHMVLFFQNRQTKKPKASCLRKNTKRDPKKKHSDMKNIQETQNHDSTTSTLLPEPPRCSLWHQNQRTEH